MFIVFEMSAVWHSGSERRFYNDHDRKVNGSTPNLVLDKMLHDDYFCLVESGKQQIEPNPNGTWGLILTR